MLGTQKASLLQEQRTAPKQFGVNLKTPSGDTVSFLRCLPGLAKSLCQQSRAPGDGIVPDATGKVLLWHDHDVSQHREQHPRVIGTLRGTMAL